MKKEYTGEIITVNDEFHYPIIIIHISGYIKEEYHSFKFIVDTGFTDFMQMPFDIGKHLGLIVIGAEEMKIANGASQANLSCLGKIKYEDMVIEENIQLSLKNDSPYMVGMKFLKKFDLDLELSIKNKVVKLIRAE